MTVWIESPFDSLPIEGYRKQRYWLMAEAFVRAGHRVVYWTSDFSHATKKRRERRVEVEGRSRRVEGRSLMVGEGFRLEMIPTRPYGRNVCLARIRSHRDYARTWERMAVEAVAAGETRPDVIIVSSPPVSTGAVGRRLARRFGAKFVVDVQDAWPETFHRLLPRGFRRMGRFLFSGMRKAAGDAYRAADLVTGVCDRYESLVKGYGAKDYYRAYLGIEGSRSRESKSKSGRLDIESRVEVEETNVRNSTLGLRLHTSTNTVRLVYVGNLGVSYDLKTVIEGVRLMNRRGGRVTLDVAGFGGRVECDGAVKFHGMLNQVDLQRLLSECDIGIIPLRADSFVGIPNKLGEYAAAGLKVVSSLQGETEALLARYRCGETYRAGSAESFAKAVEAARKLPADGGERLLADELSAERIYDAYCKRICAL